MFPLLYPKLCVVLSPPKWSCLLCSAHGRTIGTHIATPEVQANVLHLRIWNRCQGKVPVGRPGNHASQHALCEWQEEGVTEWELCANGHLGSCASSKTFSSNQQCLNALFPSHALTFWKQYYHPHQFCTIALPNLKGKQKHLTITLFCSSSSSYCQGRDVHSCNIILLLRGMSRISGCHDWLQQWQSVFISLPSVLAHAKRSESVSSFEKTWASTEC